MPVCVGMLVDLHYAAHADVQLCCWQRGRASFLFIRWCALCGDAARLTEDVNANMLCDLPHVLLMPKRHACM